MKRKFLAIIVVLYCLPLVFWYAIRHFAISVKYDCIKIYLKAQTELALRDMRRAVKNIVK